VNNGDTQQQFKITMQKHVSKVRKLSCQREIYVSCALKATTFKKNWSWSFNFCYLACGVPVGITSKMILGWDGSSSEAHVIQVLWLCSSLNVFKHAKLSVWVKLASFSTCSSCTKLCEVPNYLNLLSVVEMTKCFVLVIVSSRKNCQHLTHDCSWGMSNEHLKW